MHLEFLVGTMIELPRAALTAGQIAEAAEFFSFGTNDLTQTTWGFSRDDVEAAFFSHYLEKGIFGVSPFESIDREGVGELVRIAAEQGRARRPGLKLGVCGEHGGDPDSVHFFDEVGLDYVSCSPFRVPVARLEAGRADLQRRVNVRIGDVGCVAVWQRARCLSPFTPRRGDRDRLDQRRRRGVSTVAAALERSDRRRPPIGLPDGPTVLPSNEVLEQILREYRASAR